MLSRIEIKEELELFIEWPTDDHGSVSATSTALFAHHVQQKATEKLRAELERVTAEHEQYKRDAERFMERARVLELVAMEMRGWISCEDVNHKKGEFHDFGECPVLARIDAALNQQQAEVKP